MPPFFCTAKGGNLRVMQRAAPETRVEEEEKLLDYEANTACGVHCNTHSGQQRRRIQSLDILISSK